MSPYLVKFSPFPIQTSPSSTNFIIHLWLPWCTGRLFQPYTNVSRLSIIGMSKVQLIQELLDKQASVCAYLSALVIAAYDTILTLDDEVRFIWHSERRCGSYLYIITRYMPTLLLALGFYAVYANYHGKITHGQCPVFYYVLSTMNLLMSFGLNGLPMCRAYALSHKIRWVKALLLCSFVIQLVVKAAKIPFPPCGNVNRVYHILLSLSGATIMVFDGIILSVVIYQTWYQCQIQRQCHLRDRLGLSELVLQQGVIQFLVIFTWALKIAITQLLVRDTITNIDLPVNLAVSASLICRFYLQLRDCHGQLVEATIPTHDSEVHFYASMEASIVDELGFREHNTQTPEGASETITLHTFSQTEHSAKTGLNHAC